jgi:2-keto-4-pentenoate hydratase
MDNPKIIANALGMARRSGRSLDEFPIALPDGLPDAYQIQELEIQNLGKLEGWKIAAIKPELRERHGAVRLAGPIIRLIDARLLGNSSAEVPVIVGGLAAVEAEFAVLIGEDLPIRSSPYSEAELADAVSSLHIAIEIAGSPLANLSDLGPTAVAADHGNNVAVIVGNEIADWRQRPLDTLITRTTINGEVVGEGSAARLDGGPLGALAYLVSHLSSRGRFLKAGDWVSTGATTGMHKVMPGSDAIVEFGSAGRISVRIIPHPGP